MVEQKKSSQDSILEFSVRFILPLAITILFHFLYEGINKWIISLSLGIIITILINVGYKFFDIKMSMINNYQNIEKNLIDIKSSIERHLLKMIDQNALFTHDNSLENKLNILKKVHSSSVWVVSKFISRQISKNINNLKFKIKANEYSKFSSELYKEPEKSLYITNSINFYSWFNVLEKEHSLLPDHVKTWNELTIEKKRLVILTKSDRENLFVYEEYFQKFIHQTKSKNENTRFISLEDFKNKTDFETNLNILNYDYALYDSSVLLKWENPLYFKEETELELMINIEESHKSLLNIFGSDVWNTLQTHQDLEKLIIKQKDKFKYLTLKNKSIDHRYSYFGKGASVWENINKDNTYKLGIDEQHYLEHFLSKTLHLDNMKTSNIFHIGSGGGKEIKSVLNSIPHNLIDKYYVLDISSNMLDRAKKTLKEDYSFKFGVNYSYFIEVDMLGNDVDEKIRTKLSNSSNIFLLVSNGYLLSNDIVLSNIKNLMSENDILVITVENSKSDFDQISSYKTESVIKLFEISLKLIGIKNISQNYFEFKCDNHIFEGYFNIKNWSNDSKEYLSLLNLKDKEYLDKLIHLEKIKIFESSKPDKETLIQRLKTFHLEEDNNELTKFDKGRMIGGIFKRTDI